MPRPAEHSTDSILDAAASVLFRGGIEATTIQAISKESGAPVGSLYNRFSSRRDLLAQLWLRAAHRSQAAALPALQREDPVLAALELARLIIEFTRSEPVDARLLASLGREDLMTSELSPEVALALREVNARVDRALKQLSLRLFGDARSDSVRRLSVAVLALPLAAVKPYLLAGRSVPASVDRYVLRAARAIVDERGVAGD